MCGRVALFERKQNATFIIGVIIKYLTMVTTLQKMLKNILFYFYFPDFKLTQK